MPKPRVIVIGAGFGGLYVARALAARARAGTIDLAIVNRVNYFLFTPLLHEVATGGLTPTSVTEPLREIFGGTPVRVLQGDVTAIDAARKIVRTTAGDFAYDVAVLATGAENESYGVPGVDAFGLPLKTLADAVRIRERVIEAFERAERAETAEERDRLHAFAVVGGGATGVELAAELAEFLQGLDRAHGRPAPSAARIALVNAAPELLAQFPASLRAAAETRLRSIGVDVRNGASVAAISGQGIALADGASIPAATVIWTAGVRPRPPAFEGASVVIRGGRVVVGADLRVVGADGLFALGDVAAIEGAPTPMLAQAAVAQARVVARNVLATVRGAPLADFRFRPKGLLVSLGQWFAVGEVFSRALRGRFAWWLWRTIYLFKFASGKKRLRIAFEWTVNLFYPRDITRVG